jgi:hypothetical protein
MNDLLARIDELRRARPKVMGDKEWILAGSRVLLRRRQDWRDWGQSGLAFLFFGGGALAIALSDWDRYSGKGVLDWLGVLIFCLWISGFGHLLFRKCLFELDWEQQAMTKPLLGGEVTPLLEIECIVGEPRLQEVEGPTPLYAVLRNGRHCYLPNLLRVSSLRRNTAAYGFILDKPALFLHEKQQLADLYLADGQPVADSRQPRRIDLARLWAAEAERLSSNAWRDDWSESSQRESAPRKSRLE